MQFGLQNYEKTRAEQKNSFFFMPRRSIFAIFDGKDTKKILKTLSFQNYSVPLQTNFRKNVFPSAKHDCSKRFSKSTI